jgi:hypothetical protein
MKPLLEIKSADLKVMTKAELQEVFDASSDFDRSEVGRDEILPGEVINGNLFWATKLGCEITNIFWKGKRFYEEYKGNNYLLSLTPWSSKHFFKFDFHCNNFIESPISEKNNRCFGLRYNSYPDNPYPISNILDEMRKVNDNLYIGTGNFQLPWGSYILFDWYYLERQ